MKALLMGYYGARNLGDEMMLVCLRPWLENQGFELTILSEFPEEIERSHGLPSVANWPLLGQWAWKTAWLRGGALGVIRALIRTDALIVGGGDLIRDDCGWRQFMFSLEKVLLARVLGKKVFLVNTGVGQPHTRWARRLLQWALRSCDRIIVRDQRSLDLCRELGAGETTTLVPDIVLALPELLQPLGPHSASVHLKQSRHPYILVSLRGGANSFRLYDLTDARIRTFASALDRLVDRHDVDIVFLAFHSPVGNEVADNRLHARVLAAMRHRARARLQNWTDDLEEVCALFQRAQGVIAMRLHAAVLAAANKRPTVLMPSDHKIREFADLVGIPALLEPETLDTIEAVWNVLDPVFAHESIQSTSDGNEEAQRLDTWSLSRAVFHAWGDLSLTRGTRVVSRPHLTRPEVAEPVARY